MSSAKLVPLSMRSKKPQSSTTTQRSASKESADPVLKKHISWQTWLKIVLVSVAVIAAIGYIIWDVVARGPLTSLLTNRDELVALVRSWGIFAPLIYIALQVLQTVVAPIPGQIVGGIGGFIFGGWGILWSTIGTLLGCFIVFKIARRFGRPLLEKIFKKSAIEKFDFIINAKSASLILFLIFLLPGFPDDIVCYIAALTKLPIRRLMLILILGRFPVIVVTNFIGAGITTNLSLVITISIISVIILGIAIWQRERITNYLKKTANATKTISKKISHESSGKKPKK